MQSYYLHDGQGSVRTLTNASGVPTDHYAYDAFGNAYAPGTSGTTMNPYRYTGQQFDAATGLYDLRARYYDPTQGRFLGRDTNGVDLSNPVELNRYAYTANNPINQFDPSGHDSMFSYLFQAMKNDLAAAEMRRVGLGMLEGGVAGALGYIAGIYMAANWAGSAIYDTREL
ncbi:MAG: RHS repeat-associated core domain-containing protein [Aggregatilineales bacterium]